MKTKHFCTIRSHSVTVASYFCHMNVDIINMSVLSFLILVMFGNLTRIWPEPNSNPTRTQLLLPNYITIPIWKWMVKCFQSKFWQFLYFIFLHSVAKYLSQGIWLVISEVTRNWFRISEKELSYRNIISSSALSVHIKTFYHLTSEFEGLYCSLRCTKLLDQSQRHNPKIIN